MLQLSLWILIAYGMTSIIVWGAIFEDVRGWIKKRSKFFGDLISCTLCTATWVGFFLSICLGGLTSTTFGVHWLIGIFFDGMLTAGAVWVLNSLIEFFEENRIK
jgi:MFS family permease